MSIEIDLDCKPSNPKEFLRHRSAMLASAKVFSDYLVAKEVILGIEPEMYAEQWILTNLIAFDRKFQDLIVIYFIKILLAVQNSSSEEDKNV